MRSGEIVNASNAQRFRRTRRWLFAGLIAVALSIGCGPSYNPNDTPIEQALESQGLDRDHITKFELAGRDLTLDVSLKNYTGCYFLEADLSRPLKALSNVMRDQRYQLSAVNLTITAPGFSMDKYGNRKEGPYLIAILNMDSSEVLRFPANYDFNAYPVYFANHFVQFVNPNYDCWYKTLGSEIKLAGFPSG